MILRQDIGMRRNDILFVTIILLIAGAMYLTFTLGGDKDGDKVIVTVDGRIYGTYPLDEDNTINIQNADGFNTVSIHDGQVSVTDADCKDKYCVKQGTISKNNESIICLPHKLVVEIAGGKDNNESTEVDSIAK